MKPVKNTRFTVESRILKELGERLVSDVSVALTELVKNSFDADASHCKLLFSDDKIIIKDNGHGMTNEEFENKWMKISTSNKLKNNVSKEYNRRLTGSKGIGRFAVRFLGKKLKLTSIAKIGNSDINEKITVDFDWDKIDRYNKLEEIEIEYRVEQTKEETGTILEISKLRDIYEINSYVIKTVKSNVIQNINPIYGLIDDIDELDINDYKKISELLPKGFIDNNRSKKIDPGFEVLFNSDKDDESTVSVGAEVLSNFVLNAKLIMTDKHLKIFVTHNVQEARDFIIPTFEIKFKEEHTNKIGSTLYADIRFFPRRAGVFANKAVSGNDAWNWIRENCGIKIYDHGFNISPYGYEDDDWLYLDRDTAHSKREWRSSLTQKYFPMSAEDASSPKRNPMVSLPNNHQLVGIVLLNSDSKEDGSGSDNVLMPSMDRQGYISNPAFDRLRSVIRFAVEIIAYYDKKINLSIEESLKKDRYNSRIQEIEAVIREIKASPSLLPQDKERIVGHYTKVIESVESLETYDKESRESLEMMSLLGVVAGFMTHEYDATLEDLDTISKLLRKISREDPEIEALANKIDNSIKNFNSYIEYTRLFVNNIHHRDIKPYHSLYSIEHVLESFEALRLERGIDLELEIDDSLIAPMVPVAMYQGLVLNLYTNALKILLDHKGENKKILVEAFDKGNKHYIRVSDNGPGIPSDVRNRIWDALYTTTSKQNNSLGSGMGLGLALVKRVVESQHGIVQLVEPKPNYSTCFEIQLPIKK